MNESQLPEINGDYETQQQEQDTRELEQICVQCITRVATGSATVDDAMFLANILGLTHYFIKGH